MSIDVMTAVWRESQSEGRARLVLLAIADYQGEIGAWPSIATLAQMVNASERSIQRDIRELEVSGELIVLERQAPTRAHHKSNLYWVNLPSVADKIQGVFEVTDSGLEVTNSDLEVTDSHLEVTPVGVITITKPLEEPLPRYMPKKNQNEFEEFWELYPRKVGRKDAIKSFGKALKRESFYVILAGVTRLANDPNLPPAQYIPYPATWLNREGWLDEPYPVRELSREEKLAQAAVKSKQVVDADKRATEAFLKEQEEQRVRAEQNKAESCEHRAVKMLCKICR